MLSRRLYVLEHMTLPQMLLTAIAIIAVVIPSVFILRRMGFSGWWAVVAPFSPLNLVGLWILAFKKWPVESRISH